MHARGVVGVTLSVPAELDARLRDAVVAGTAEAADWSRRAPAGTADAFDRDSLDAIPAPPEGASELAQMHSAADARTPEGVQRAQELARDGGWTTWHAVVDDLRRSGAVQQARDAARLLEEVYRRQAPVVNDAKAVWKRPRPYELDRSLTTCVTRPDGNPGYPSGHSATAFAAALVLGAIVPERASELLDVAVEVAWSRVYGGVHYPSDVVMGARVAARAAADLLRRDAANRPAA